jgi:hypothetical protein
MGLVVADTTLPTRFWCFHRRGCAGGHPAHSRWDAKSRERLGRLGEEHDSEQHREHEVLHGCREGRGDGACSAGEELENELHGDPQAGTYHYTASVRCVERGLLGSSSVESD